MAQSIDWVKTNGSLKHDACYNIFKEKDHILTIASFNDSFNIADTGSIKEPTGNCPNCFYWIFRNQNGTIRKIQKIQQDSIGKQHVRKLNNGSYFLNLDYSMWDSFYLSNQKIVSKKDYPIVKIDTHGNTKLFALIKNLKSRVFRPTLQIESFGENIGVYFSMRKDEKILIEEDTVTADSSITVLLKYNSHGKLIEKKTYAISASPWALDYCSNNKHRLLSTFRVNDSFTFKNTDYKYDRYNNIVTYLIDSNLNISSFKKLPGGNWLNRSIVAFDTNKYFYNADYFIDNVKDSITIGETKYILPKGRHSFVVFVSNKKIKFAKRMSTTNSLYTNPIQKITFSKHLEYCAVGAQIVNKLLILPDSIYVDTDDNDGNIFGIKLDTFGNILWYFTARSDKSFDQFHGLLLANSGAYFTGSFGRTLSLNGDSFQSKGGSDGLTIKITDNSIIRGDINPGPYCAGDTILIPYRAYGKYNDTNRFFAELSDENGNFFGSQTELGSLRSDSSGTIKTTLPLFDVKTSKNYRIRIRSNSPFVQSFMRYDSFRLLIYSKDKANPGKDTTLCFGDTLDIYCIGGTTWNWSPNTNVLNPNKRETKFVATQTSNLQIAIADSSGCGQPDTAYQKITVITKPIISTRDTQVCRSLPFTLYAKSSYSGTDTIKYAWLLNNTKIKADSLNATILKDSAFTLIAYDACPKNHDTATIKVSLHSPPSFSLMVDSVCSYTKASIEFTNVDAIGPYHFIKDGVLSSVKSHIPAQKPKTHLFALRDACGQEKDTAILLSEFPLAKYTLSPKRACPPLSSTIAFTNPDNDTIKLSSNSSVKITQSKDSFAILCNAPGLHLLEIELTNQHCKINSAENLTVDPLPIAKLSSQYSSYLAKQKSAILYNNSIGANFYQWVMPNRTAIKYNTDTVILHFNESDTMRTALIARNPYGCSDTAWLETIIYPPAYIIFPNALSMNNDQLNEIFEPVFKGLQYYELSVFNRWGEMVFKGKNNGWKPNPKILPGLYVYRCVYQGHAEKPQEKNGTLIIIR